MCLVLGERSTQAEPLKNQHRVSSLLAYSHFFLKIQQMMAFDILGGEILSKCRPRKIMPGNEQKREKK
jgi:hypothetical protein